MKNFKEILTALGLVVILTFLMDPMGMYYHNMTVVFSITILILLFVSFSIFVWKDKPADEREEVHQSFAGRVAFLSGTALMIIGVVVQSFNHAIDFWLVLALIVMIISKLIALRYSERNN